MNHWLFKSEPSAYGWDDLIRDGGTRWDGVRNAQAAIHIRAMRPGDEALIYHSMSEKAAVGIARVAGPPEPDGDAGKWAAVPIAPVSPLPRPVTLAQMKADPRLFGLAMIRQSRLSVSPVTEEEWKVILELAKAA